MQNPPRVGHWLGKRLSFTHRLSWVAPLAGLAAGEVQKKPQTTTNPNISNNNFSCPFLFIPGISVQIKAASDFPFMQTRNAELLSSSPQHCLQHSQKSFLKAAPTAAASQKTVGSSAHSIPCPSQILPHAVTVPTKWDHRVIWIWKGQGHFP